MRQAGQAAESRRVVSFGGRRVLSVAAVRGRWLGVSVPERPNGKLGWIDSKAAGFGRSRLKVSIRADLSARRIDLVVGRRVVKRLRVAIGRAGSPTPTGRFAVTDKIAGNRYGPYYGCCILAISGRQTRLPPGWQGGDLLAIHGGPAWSLGSRRSAGCLHAAETDLRWLMRRIPLGTPITIHP